MVKLEFIKTENTIFINLENNWKVTLGQENWQTQWIPRGCDIDNTRCPLTGFPMIPSTTNLSLQ